VRFFDDIRGHYEPFSILEPLLWRFAVHISPLTPRDDGLCSFVDNPMHWPFMYAEEHGEPRDFPLSAGAPRCDARNQCI